MEEVAFDTVLHLASELLPLTSSICEWMGVERINLPHPGTQRIPDGRNGRGRNDI